MSRSILNLIGVVVLLLGLGSVAIIERNARCAEANKLEENESNYFLLHPEESRAYMRSAEEMGGAFGVLLDRWVQAVEDLGHSRPFAIAVAVVSLATATGLFAAATFRK